MLVPCSRNFRPQTSGEPPALVPALPFVSFIVYRRWTMNETQRPLDRAIAAEYASWFKALADPTRIQIV